MTNFYIIIAVILVIIGLYRWMTAPGKTPPQWVANYKYAHRGLHNSVFPENSMPAFSQAIENGYGIELDVHLSSDGVVMVFHDDELDRMTKLKGELCKYSADVLTKLQLSNTEYTLPTLQEVLELVEGQVPLLIEVKSTGQAGALEENVYRILKSYKGKFAIQSFSPLSLRWFYKNDPMIPIGQLSSCFKNNADQVAWIARFCVQRLLTNFLCRPSFISYDVDGLEQRVLRRLRKRGTPVLAWTVRDRQCYNQLGDVSDTVIFEGFYA